MQRAVGYAREINPGLQFFFTSALTGLGLDEWIEFVRTQTAEVATA